MGRRGRKGKRTSRKGRGKGKEGRREVLVIRRGREGVGGRLVSQIIRQNTLKINQKCKKKLGLGAVDKNK